MRIVKAIVHEIPKGKFKADAGSTVGLSTESLELTADTRRFITDSIVRIAVAKQRRIIEDSDLQADLPEVIRAILQETDNDDLFVNRSQRIAHLLHQAHNAQSPAGVLVVALLVEEGTSKILLLKAEHQEGMRLKKNIVDGEQVIDLEHLRELIVGHNAKVYKIALLKVLNDTEKTVLGTMVDHQSNDAYAAFFLHEFLGCRLQDTAELQTKRFVDEAFVFINDSIESIQDRARYGSAVMTYIAQPSDEIDVKEFIETHIAPEHRDDFSRAMGNELLDSVFDKDVRLLSGKITGMRYSASGVSITASVDALDSKVVDFLEDEDGNSFIKIKADIDQLEISRAPKKY